MKLKNMIAKIIGQEAIRKAYRTAGRSIPVGMHEVKVPKELCLKQQKEK